MNRFIILIALACSAFGQDNSSRYIALKETTLAAATEKVTVQQPASPTKIIVFESASVYCTVACDFSILQNGTAATTTTLAVTAVNQSAAGTGVAFSSSNSSGGTTLVKYSVPAGGTVPVDLSKLYMDNRSTTQNLSILTTSITGTARIVIQWTEK